MGLVAESSIPSHLRWLPMGMSIDYKKKAMGTLTATSDIDPDALFQLASFPGKISVPVDVKNEKGEVVTSAHVSYNVFKLSEC